MESIRVGVAGATGRMGAAVIAAVRGADGMELGAALVRPGGEVPAGIDAVDALTALVAGCDVVVDFSRPALLADLADACRQAGRPLVSGTTGLDDAATAALQRAASTIAVVHAPNMSVGVNLLSHLVDKASESLGPDWQCEIFDAHHAHKVDAPSGTALRLGAIVEGRRGPGSVAYAVEREGETIGFHEVRFGGPGECLVLGHEALDRGIFAHGALRAARWVTTQPPGFYGMDSVLGLKSR